MVCINGKSTTHNELSTAVIGRDNGAAGSNLGRTLH